MDAEYTHASYQGYPIGPYTNPRTYFTNPESILQSNQGRTPSYTKRDASVHGSSHVGSATLEALPLEPREAAQPPEPEAVVSEYARPGLKASGD